MQSIHCQNIILPSYHKEKTKSCFTLTPYSLVLIIYLSETRTSFLDGAKHRIFIFLYLLYLDTSLILREKNTPSLLLFSVRLQFSHLPWILSHRLNEA